MHPLPSPPPPLSLSLFHVQPTRLTLPCIQPTRLTLPCIQPTRLTLPQAHRVSQAAFCLPSFTLPFPSRYKEYISVGKGRDMGFDSINGFNFKIAGGGGEWAISRESWRMGTRLDFFRLMFFYHSAVGFYVNSLFTSIAIYWNVYTLLLFAWAESTEIQAGSVTRIYNTQNVRGVGGPGGEGGGGLGG